MCRSIRSLNSISTVIVAIVWAVLCVGRVVAQDVMPSGKQVRPETSAPPPAASQPGASDDSSSDDDPDWPRTYIKAATGQQVIVYPPQVDSWEKYRDISFRCAIVVTVDPSTEPIYGIAQVKARTAVDTEARLVRVDEPEYVFRFPDANAESDAACQQLIDEVLPQRQTMTVSLDLLLALVNAPDSQPREVEVNLDPPPIFYSNRPAILVMFDGDPRFKPVAGSSLMFAINCNWDVFVDPSTATSYLLFGESWIMTRDLHKGPWEPARKLPAAFETLPKDASFIDIRDNVPGKPLDVMPAVFMSRVPAEIIVTDGEPIYASIPGVRLRAVSNTESPLFRHAGDLNFYFLAAGRWFRAKSLEGPWTAATKDLPVEFKQIPRDCEWTYALSSVPGTDEAADAVMLASVPRRATVNINEVDLSVVYEGQPRFVPIEGTTIEGATNTTSQVFRCSNRYYCCENAVWFESGAATGPWAVCKAVPDAIYAIPPTSEAHNVTYAKVLEAKNNEVEVAYTSGYNDAFVTATVLVLGAGVVAAVIAADDVQWNVHANLGGNTISSYGRGAFYDSGVGGFCRSGAAYGPYGGTGGAASWNAATSSWARRGSSYSANSSAAGRDARSLSNTFGAQIGSANRFAAWSRGVVSRDNDRGAGGRSSAMLARAGWAESSQNAANGRGGGGRGGQAALARNKSGDIYVGRDGNVYKRDAGGQWQERAGGGWRNAGDASNGTRALDAEATARGRSLAASDRASTSRRTSGVGNRGAGAGGGRRGR